MYNYGVPPLHRPTLTRSPHPKTNYHFERHVFIIHKHTKLIHAKLRANFFFFFCFTSLLHTLFSFNLFEQPSPLIALIWFERDPNFHVACSRRVVVVIVKFHRAFRDFISSVRGSFVVVVMSLPHIPTNNFHDFYIHTLLASI